MNNLIISKIKLLLEENTKEVIDEHLSYQDRLTLFEIYESDTGHEPDSTLEAIDHIISFYPN